MLMWMGAGDPSSNPHIYMANTLLPESHAQPCSNVLCFRVSILWDMLYNIFCGCTMKIGGVMLTPEPCSVFQAQ